MFPVCNFSAARPRSARRTRADGFGQVSPIALAETVDDHRGGDQRGDEREGDDDCQIVSQRFWPARAPDLTEAACRRVFDEEANIIDRLSTLRENNSLIKTSLVCLRAYRTEVIKKYSYRKECLDLLRAGSDLKNSRHGLRNVTNAQHGIVVGDQISSCQMKNLPLSRSDLFQLDYIDRHEDYVGGGALAVVAHPVRPERVVACYPSPSRRDVLRFASLSSLNDEDDSLRCRAVEVDTPVSDATQIVGSPEFHRILVLSRDLLRLIDLGRFDEDDKNKGGVELSNSLAWSYHDFRSRLVSMDFNRWIETEAVVSSEDGDTRLWDLETGHLLKLFTGEVRFDDRASPPGSQVLFGSHPRRVVHGNETGVAIWDVRRRNNGSSVDLFALPHVCLDIHERVCRVSRSRLDSHLFHVVTSRSVIAIDERMPDVPVLNVKHALRRRPQFTTSSTSPPRIELLFVGRQMPWEVNAISLSKDEPSMPVRLAGAAQRCQSPRDTRCFALVNKTIKDLIGLATLEADTADGRLWQLSSACELFETNFSSTRVKEKRTPSRGRCGDVRRPAVGPLTTPTDARETWRLLTSNAEKERDSTGDCLLCRRSSAGNRTDRLLFDDDDDDDDEAESTTNETCSSCDLDKAHVVALKQARLSRGFIRHHAEPAIDVEEAFERMTLKERFAPEAGIFTLNKANLDAFLKDCRREDDGVESSPDDFGDEEASFDDFSTFWESDLIGLLSQESLSGMDGYAGKLVTPWTDKPWTDKRYRRKRSSLSDSPGFCQTPNKVKKRMARCLWNPYFMQHVRCATPERLEEDVVLTEGGDEHSIARSDIHQCVKELHIDG